MIVTDCTRAVERIAFHQCENADKNAGWLFKHAVTPVGTIAERLEIRDYNKSSALPLFYTGACLPPQIVKPLAEGVSVKELSFPTMKAETKITGCDVDENRITPEGTIDPVLVRWQRTVDKGISDMLLQREATLHAEAISLVKYGSYALHASPTEVVDVIDYNRKAELSSIDLTGTKQDFCDQCSKPLKVIEEILRNMSRCGGVSGPVDIIWSEVAWNAFEAHDERDAVKYGDRPDIVTGLDTTLLFGYNEVGFKGTTNAGQLRHWISFAEYYDHTGTLKPMVDPGEILILSKNGFNAKMVYRRTSSDGKELLPEGLPFWIHDSELEYNRKCRSFEPWIEGHHLMVPENVNGAALVRVTADTCEPCINCEECP